MWRIRKISTPILGKTVNINRYTISSIIICSIKWIISKLERIFWRWECVPTLSLWIFVIMITKFVNCVQPHQIELLKQVISWNRRFYLNFVLHSWQLLVYNSQEYPINNAWFSPIVVWLKFFAISIKFELFTLTLAMLM